MKIRLIREDTIKEFIKDNAGSRAAFTGWLNSLDSADWNTINDIGQTFNSADVIDNNRIVFNIGGNNYRMICKFHFGIKKVHLYIKWLGTHADYDRLCRNNEQYTVSKY